MFDDTKRQSEVVKRGRTDNVMSKTKDTKGQSEVVMRGRTDNVMSKTKGSKGQTIIYKTQHRKLETEQHEPH